MFQQRHKKPCREAIERLPQLPDKPMAAVHIGFTFILPDNRRRDPDNLLANAKPWIDALVDAGLILDDSAAVLRRWTIQPYVSIGVRETIITLTDLTEVR